MGWSHIGGPAEEVFDSFQYNNPVLYKTGSNLGDPSITGDVAVFTPHTRWRTIGGPGSMFAVNSLGLWGLTPNKDAIFLRPAYPEPFGNQAWERVGGPANRIIAGDGQVTLYTAQGSGDLHIYGDQGWHRIGGPGYMFAISGSPSLPYLDSPIPPSIYGVTPEQMEIWRFLFTDDFQISGRWERVTRDNQLGRVNSSGGVVSRIRSIIAGETEVYVDVEVVSRGLSFPGNIYRYGGTPGTWTQIGSRLGELAIQRPYPNTGMVDTLYSFSHNEMKLRRYTGSGTNWQLIDLPNSSVVHQVFSGYGRILVTLSDGDIWQYN